MIPADFENLKPGDEVEHISHRGIHYQVQANYGGRITAARTVDMTNPAEWRIVSKVTGREIPLR